MLVVVQWYLLRGEELRLVRRLGLGSEATQFLLALAPDP